MTDLSFETVYTSTPLSMALVCPWCGAHVATSAKDRHVGWHQQVSLLLDQRKGEAR